MTGLHIVEEHDAPEHERQALVERLREHNHRFMPLSEPQPLCLFLRDGRDAILGGLLAETRWHWMFVEVLWVSDVLRGRGHGSALLARAERVARERGARKATLDTAEFQARGFYLKHGYRVFAVQEDLPPASRRYFMEKLLVDTGIATR
jgi:GNAT superfamily N-acetyltransferase